MNAAAAADDADDATDAAAAVSVTAPGRLALRPTWITKMGLTK